MIWSSRPPKGNLGPKEKHPIFAEIQCFIIVGIYSAQIIVRYGSVGHRRNAIINIAAWVLGGGLPPESNHLNGPNASRIISGNKIGL